MLTTLQRFDILYNVWESIAAVCLSYFAHL